MNGYSDMIQSFHRFLIDLLCKEGNYYSHNPAIVPNPAIIPSGNKTSSHFAAPVTQLLAFEAKQVIVCRSCKAKRCKETVTHILELVYPKAVSGIAPSQRQAIQILIYSQNPAISTASTTEFETIVRDSLIRASTYKATCSTCVQTVTFDSRKAIPSKVLPPILAMNTCIYQPGIASHKLWLDTRQGTLLKPFIEIRGQVDGVDDEEVVQYELVVSSSFGLELLGVDPSYSL